MLQIWIVQIALAAGLVTPGGVSPAPAEDFVVIVNAANGSAALDKAAIRAYYLGKKAAWPDSAKVRAVDNPEGAEGRTQFVTQVLGMSIAEFERYWIERQYVSGDGPPAKATDEASVIKLVELFKGGIGFISKSALEKARDAKVKAVLTIGAK